MELCFKSQGKTSKSLNYNLYLQILFQNQMNMILKGFEDVISPQNIEIFTEEELGLLIGGVSTINIKDWRDNTE